MNKSILFYKEGAEELNKLVQKKIAAHLFLMCNYDPNSVPVYSEDSRFILGVLNLYKFVIDAGLINQFFNLDKNLGGVLCKNNKTMFDELTGIIQLANDLRTTFAHNISGESGTDDVRKRSLKWLERVTGKENVESASDYTKAVDALENVVNRAYSIIYHFILKITKEYELTMIIREWEIMIVKFYNSSTNVKILQAQLNEAYLSRHPSSTNIKWDVAKWCKEHYVAVLNQSIGELQNLYFKNRHLMNLDDIKKIENFIKEKKDKLSHIIKRIADKYCNGEVEKVTIYNYKDYYIANAADRYLDLIPDLTKNRYTMLPQDMMQYMIECDFQ